MQGQTTPTAAPVAGRQCGTCALCCKVYDTPVTDSRAGAWCRHCRPGHGCDIHATRPQQCVDFYCLWMTLDILSPDWKPEKARFVLTMDAGTRWLYVQVDPGAPQAWRKEPYYSQLKRWSAAGQRPVIVFNGVSATAVMPDRDVVLGTIALDERIVLRDEGVGASARRTVAKVKLGA